MKTRQFSSMALLLFIVGPMLAQQKDNSVHEIRAAQKISLGRTLFRSPLLSGNKNMTCATCHEPDLSFTDGVAESPGILGGGVGRNSPTLFGIGHVKQFPGPRLSSRRPLASSKALTLAERCLLPIENPLEMASSVEEALGRLRNASGMPQSFTRAFGPSTLGITPRRIGQALAAFLKSIQTPNSPFKAFLAGNHQALTEIEKQGLKIFNTTGACSQCHQGKALSDGLLHVAFLPGSKRDLAQSRRSAELARDARQRFTNMGMTLPKTGIGQQLFARLAPPLTGCDATMNSRSIQRTTYDGQDPRFRQMHTLSLWDVARTAPYFRDGSATTLLEALQTHVSELRAVSSSWKNVRAQRKQAMSRGSSKVDRALLPKWARMATGIPTPEDITSGDLRALLVFLKTLSPTS